MKLIQNWKRLIIAAAVIILQTGCGGGDWPPHSKSAIARPGPGLAPALALTNGNGVPLARLDAGDALSLHMENLVADAFYRIYVAGPGGELLSPPNGFVASANENGTILDHIIVQNLSRTAVTTNVSDARNTATGNYQVRIVDMQGNEVAQESVAVENNSRVFCAAADGKLQGSFTTSEDVFASIERADGQLADGDYSVHVLSDTQHQLRNDDPLPAAIGQVSMRGGVGLILLGRYAAGTWDVVVDIDHNGRYTLDTDLMSRPGRLNPCFTIQAPASTTPIVAQIASDAKGNHRDLFDPNSSNHDIRDVFAFITPTQRSLGGDTLGVDKYVVSHQNVWNDGDALVDVTSGLETDPVQGFCTNEAPWRVWSRRLLQPGCFDAVVDVNQNGRYDVGYDFLDNIDQAGNPTCGFRVADKRLENNIQLETVSPGQVIAASAFELRGTVASLATGELPRSGGVIVTAGEQTSRLSLTPSTAGLFSAAIPLFVGDNQLTVFFEYPSGASAARTVNVTSQLDQAVGTEALFRAQLLWGGRTDMDLHLVRPNGQLNSPNDCNYRNCTVGMTNPQPNSLDWGAPGETDDPKLDVDCRACGNGIENIFLTSMPEDGVYTVYVHAYSGSEANVDVNIFVRGAQVATVNCGPIGESAPSSLCRAGTLKWTGGNTGTGIFILDGAAPSTTAAATSRALYWPKKSDAP